METGRRNVNNLPLLTHIKAEITKQLCRDGLHEKKGRPHTVKYAELTQTNVWTFFLLFYLDLFDLWVRRVTYCVPQLYIEIIGGLWDLIKQLHVGLTSLSLANHRILQPLNQTGVKVSLLLVAFQNDNKNAGYSWVAGKLFQHCYTVATLFLNSLPSYLCKPGFTQHSIYSSDITAQKSEQSLGIYITSSAAMQLRNKAPAAPCHITTVCLPNYSNKTL